MALLLSALMLVSFAACSGNKNNNNNKGGNTSQNNNIKTDKTPAEIERVIAKALGEGYLCTVDVPEDEMFSSAISWLNLEQIENYVAKQSASYGQDSVVIVKCKPGYADEAVTKLNEFYAQTISYIRQYPFDVAKVEGARIYKVGDVVMFIIAGASYEGEDKEAEAKLAAEEYKKVDDALKNLFGALPENLAVIPQN